MKDLQNKKLLSDKVATVASIIAKDKKIRKLVHAFQLECAYNPPKMYNGSCLDGRDIGSVVVKNADVKFYITANVKVRAMRRYKELKAKNKKITYKEVLKSIQKRDKSDKNRKISPLKKTKDMVLLNSSSESISSCFTKIKKIIDRKISN
jgi:cytidylate kinase